MYIFLLLVVLINTAYAIMFNVNHYRTDMLKLAHSISGKKSTTAAATKLISTDDDDTISNSDMFNDITDENKSAMDMLMHLFNIKSGWIYVNEKDGVTVEKRYISKLGNYIRSEDVLKGEKHACVKASGIINATPDAVYRLFLNNDQVHEYNEHCSILEDVIHIPEKSTKISWACTPKYGPFKARDFCSIVHFIKRKDGSRIILNRPAYHDNYKKSSKYVRATILLAGNIIEPYGKDQSYLTQISHINPGGGADTKAAAWIINNLCAVGPPTFIRKLEVAAVKSEANNKGRLHRVGGGNLLMINPAIAINTAAISTTTAATEFFNKLTSSINANIYRKK